MNQNPSLLNRYWRWTLLSGLCGVLAGGAAALFLYLLEWVTHFRETHPLIIWFLPIAGFAIGFMYYKWGQDIEEGNGLIIDEIHKPQKHLPFKMTPLVLMGTLLTHLCGGSAGREGTAVQMGASLADQLSGLFKIQAEERKILLISGAGAGFGAAIGAPWAGAIFGFEMTRIKHFKVSALYHSLVASWVGYGITLYLGAPHTVYPTPHIPDVSVQILLWVIIAGLAFGVASRFFILTTDIIKRWSQRLVPHSPLTGQREPICVVGVKGLDSKWAQFSPQSWHLNCLSNTKKGLNP